MSKQPLPPVFDDEPIRVLPPGDEETITFTLNPESISAFNGPRPRTPIFIQRKGFGSFEAVTGPDKPPEPGDVVLHEWWPNKPLEPGWLYDAKGQPRLGKCGHPLHPVKGCRVCPLLAKGDRISVRQWHETTSMHVRRERAMAKWGSRKGRRRANSYVPSTEQPYPSLDFANMQHGLEFCAPTIIAAREVMRAIARICPESSRTIRFRHTPFPRSVAGLADPLVIGAPLTDPTDIDSIMALTVAFGSNLVYQQAQMSSGLYGVDVDAEEFYDKG